MDDCILPNDLKTTFKDMVSAGEAQNLLLSGPPGCGKTTVARALCNDLQTDCMQINCSEDGNIDTLRTKIRTFASNVSISGNKKVVILDEFDYSNSQSMQPALRGFIEEFSSNCRFIMTCNYKNRIIQPLHSRCTNIDFTIPPSEKPKMALKMLGRINDILKNQKIKIENEEILAQLITKYFPDFRRTINELQRYSVSGVIDVGILSNIGEVDTKELMKNMKDKNFPSVRKWVVDNLNNSPSELFRKIYDSCYSSMESTSVPQAIVTLGEYQYKSAFVADQEINLTACCVELMMGCSFK